MHTDLKRHSLLIFAAVLAVAAGIVVAIAAVRRPDAHLEIVASRPVAAAKRALDDGMSQLTLSLSALDSALQFSNANDAKQAFRDARRLYKSIETLLVYFVPFETAQLNGPIMLDDDAAEPLPRTTPVGFQAVEAALFDESLSRDSARVEVARMIAVANRLRPVLATAEITEADVVDAARIEIARVTTIGLAGFDTGPSGAACLEGAEALEGLRQLMLVNSGPPDLLAAIDSTLAAAVAELRANPDFEQLNRMRFIVGFANPAARAVTALQATSGLPRVGMRRAWRETAATVFDAGAFDVTAFAPEYALDATPELISLGERLFFDPKLSGPGTRACVSCHIPDKAFTDARARAEPLPGVIGPQLRNTPTLVNTALQPTLFADDRARSLETQVGFVLGSTMEMASSPDAAATTLDADTSYKRAFRNAIPHRNEGPVTGLEVQQALAAYMRALVALNSPFDRAVRGDTSAMSAEQRFGFTVYLGKARCGTCHFVPLFNGVMPPDYLLAEPEVIGVPEHADLSRATLDPDMGRAAVEGIAMNAFAFKVSTLRNVELTAPYMHNGVFTTLEQVIDFYDKGGGAALGMHLPGQTLPSAPLKLTPEEKKALVAFLKSLTDNPGR